MKDLKEKTIRGGLARVCAQGANFFLRLVSLMVLARLLGPKDFGLVGMVTAFTGVLELFRDFGLSAAAIQRAEVTEEQMSALFWINLMVGALLGCVSIVAAPFIAGFYHEPRLSAVTMALAAGFLFNAAGVQHGALLQREMRFTAMAVINTVALAVGTVIGIGGALAGFGYWALVAMTIATPLIATVGFWLATTWVPGMPRRGIGIRSMLHFGGTVTLNGLVVYVATNFEKVLLGRYWGVDAIGLYGRAYQLINIPTANLNTAAGEVAFAALSRLQDDPRRLRSYFLKGYSLVLAFTLPLTIACALFADDVIRVFLGPKWSGAAILFRLLAPTIVVFAVANPLSWLLYSMGLIKRLLKMSLVITPIMIVAYIVGLPYGPTGVASAYSIVMTLWVIPLVIWALEDTVIRPADILREAGWPLASSIVAGALAWGVRFLCAGALSALPMLILESFVVLVIYLGMLLFVAGQKTFYLDLLRGLKHSPAKEESLVSA
jgi:PST family polysaccharide transporter